MRKISLTSSENRANYHINRPMIEKVIRITGLYLAVSHLLTPVMTVLVSLIAPFFINIEYKVAVILVAEILLLLLYIRLTSEYPRKEIEKLIKSFFPKDQLLIGLLPICFFISIVINAALDGQVRYTVNSKYLFDILLNVFVTYPIGRYYVRHKFPKGLEIFFHIVITAITVYMVYIICNVFNGETVRTFYNGKIGMNRLEFSGIPEYHLQINSHHNTSGAFAGSFMLICIILSVLKKGFFRILYILEAFVNSIILILTNSRSTFISGAVYLSLYLGLILYFVLKHKLINYNTVKKKIMVWLLSLFSVIGAFYIMSSLRDSVFTVYRKCTQDEIVIEESASSSYDKEHNFVEARDLDVSNLMSRDLIWSYAIQGMIMNNRNLLIGVTPPGIVTTIGDIGGPEFYVYSHNQLLEIGLGLGLPAMVIFAIWLIILANRCVIIGFAEETRLSLQQKLVPLLVLYLVMFNMVEAILFFGNSFIGGLFMFSSAWCFETVRSSKVNSKMFRIRTDMLKNMPTRKKQTQIEKSDIIKENERNLTETGDNNSNVSADAESINQ